MKTYQGKNTTDQYLMNIDAKTVNKTLTKQSQKQIKRIVHQDKVRFIPGM